ncbi:hypothetical protein M433DRAFT_95188 [Acidomyces richmondensis BFW]|nr:MAG: hypothetical protein FE78DRAFT_154631 [Acidomyces sp. 'richmondensis']KYG42488.1 hypothetical protein M433DRAFT_95188 [Acidomyces richmondensis BFW]
MAASNHAQSQSQFGVTPPFSTDPPNAQDLKLNDTLNIELKAQNNFAPQSDTDRRDAILRKLERLLKQMVQIVGKKKGLPQGILDSAGGKVFTYGSYKLGVYGPGSDIDTLMVAPKHVTRADFFELMPDLLRNSAEPGEITKLVPVPEASTPIIKLEIQGVDIDLIFTSLQIQSVADNTDLNDDNLIRGLDETDRRCVTGTRVAERILKLVPQTKTFRLTLRAIKLWAQRRAIYGNIAGYPGGVAYAILVARICQLYPRAAAPLLIQKFFFVIKRWNWPKPVFLQHKQETTLQLREWDPSIYRGDALHLMPILTPAMPSQNTAHTIGPSSKKVIMRELERGEEIVNGIYMGKKNWSELFLKHDFFTAAYKHYIAVITAGKTKDAATAWSGFIQSKLRWLIKGIEESDANSVELVQLFNKGFDREHECRGQENIEKVLDGSLEFQIKETETHSAENPADVKAKNAVGQESNGAVAQSTNGEMEQDERRPQKIWTTTYYLGIGLKKGATNLDISKPVSNFTNDCRSWQDYDDTVQSLRIKHMRNFTLPDDVFAPGEKRPIRPKKKGGSKTTSAEAANNKRSFSDAGLDVSADCIGEMGSRGRKNQKIEAT